MLRATVVWLWLVLLVILSARWGANMRDWGPWDWISYGGLGLTTLFVALNAAFAGLPTLRRRTPRSLRNHRWGFVPLILFGAATGVFILKEVGWLGVPSKQISAPDVGWSRDYQPIQVIGRIFNNETVALDGYQYIRCEFNNVKLVYNGATAIKLIDNKYNNVSVVTGNDGINAIISLFYYLRFIKDGISLQPKSGDIIEVAPNKGHRPAPPMLSFSPPAAPSPTTSPPAAPLPAPVQPR